MYGFKTTNFKVMAKDKFGNIKCNHIRICSARAINYCCTEKQTRTLTFKRCSNFEKSE